MPGQSGNYVEKQLKVCVKSLSPDFGNKYFKKLYCVCMFTFWTSYAGATYKTANRLHAYDDTEKGNR